MKDIIVQTTGPFMLTDRYSRAEIYEDSDKPVPHTPFITERLANGDLREVTSATEAAASPAPVADEVALEGTGGLHEALTGESPTELTGLAAVLPKIDPLDHDNNGRKGGSLPKTRRGRRGK